MSQSSNLLACPHTLTTIFHQSPQVSTSFHELIPINHRQLQLQLTSVSASASASTWTSASAFCEHLARPCGSLRKLLAARCTLLELNGSFPFRPHSPLETPPLQIALLRAKAASLDEDCTSTKKTKTKTKRTLRKFVSSHISRGDIAQNCLPGCDFCPRNNCHTCRSAVLDNYHYLNSVGNS